MMTIEYMNHESVLKLLPERDLNSHKGTFGKILLLCGSRGYTGAAALAAMAALRSGAGLVYLGVPESIYAIEAVKLWGSDVILVGREDEIRAVAKEAGYEEMPAGIEIVDTKGGATWKRV